MDRISRQRRSWNMGRIRGSDTHPELLVRSMLHNLGLRFRVNVQRLPGKPDIVLKRWGTIIFVHGCFWHQHRACKFAYKPKSRRAFWKRKFLQNVLRDKDISARLRGLGWRIAVIWECEL